MKDTLQIYDDLIAAGIPDNQAHAQARAMADSKERLVTKEDFIEANQRIRDDFSSREQKIRDDFSHTMDKLIQKVDINFKWLAGIGATTAVGIIVNIIFVWLKK